MSIRIGQYNPQMAASAIKATVAANAAGFLVFVSLVTALLPNTFILDCRANWHSSQSMSALIPYSYLLLFSLGFGGFAYLLNHHWEYRFVKYSRPSPWLEKAIVASLTLSTLILAGITGLMYYGFHQSSSWSFVVEQQREATRACAKAQGITLPAGDFDPWLSIEKPKESVGDANSGSKQ